MSRFILAEQYEPISSRHDEQWLTTGDVARILERTPKGVRWLARTGQIAYLQTESGQRLFRGRDVDELVRERARARLKGVLVFRAKKMNAHGEPRQMSLFGGQLRLVAATVIDPDSTSACGSTSRANAQEKSQV